MPLSRGSKFLSLCRVFRWSYLRVIPRFSRINQGCNKKKAWRRKSTFITTKPKNEPAPKRKYFWKKCLEKISVPESLRREISPTRSRFRTLATRLLIKEANFQDLVTLIKKTLLIQHTTDPGIKLLTTESSLIYEICSLIS